MSEQAEKKELQSKLALTEQEIDQVQGSMSMAQSKVTETQLDDMIEYCKRIEADLVAKQG